MAEKRSALCACALLACLCAATAAAQSPLEYLPADTIAFVSMPNVDKSLETFKQTALYKIWNEPDVQNFVAAPMAQLKAAIDAKLAEAKTQMQAQSGMSLDDFKGVFGGQVTFALLTLQADATWPNAQIAIVLGIKDAAKFAATCAKLDTAIRFQAEQKGKPIHKDIFTLRGVNVVAWSDRIGPPLCRASFKGQCVITITKEAMDKVLAGLGGAAGAKVGSAGSLQTINARLGGGEPDVIGYLSVKTLLDKLGGTIDPDAWKVIEALGLRELQSVASSWAIVPPGISEVHFVHLQGKRRGIFNMIRPGNAPMDLLRLAPANAQSARIGRFNFVCLWDEIIKVAQILAPQQTQAFQMALQKLETQMQINIRNDLLGSLGENFISWNRPAGMPPFGALTGFSMLWEVKNRAKLERSLKMFTSVVTMAAAAKQGQGKPAPTWREMPAGKTTIRYLVLPVPMLSPAYAVTDKYLVMGLIPMAVKQTMDGLAAKGPDIRTSADFKQAASHVTTPAVMFGYVDVKAAFSNMYASLPMILGLVQAKTGPLPIDVAALPPAQSIAKHLFGAAGCLTCDVNGIGLEYYSPFGGPTPAVVGIGAAAGIAAFRVQKQHTKARIQPQPQAKPVKPRVQPKKAKP